jgi:cellulose synthase/poly-beta-1,6-N-acetylglucosamine synthase-like glycosyltransferase
MALCTALPLLHIVVAVWPSKRHVVEVVAGERAAFSILIPCYNEMGIIHTTLRGIQQLRDYETEIILINDGSSDDSMAWMMDHLHLHEMPRRAEIGMHHQPILGVYRSGVYDNVLVIDKRNGGKADSLNAGLLYCSHELVVTLDADSVLHRDALAHCGAVFANPDVVAGGGVIKILQGSSKFHRNNRPSALNVLIKAQIMEYMKGFFILKSSLSKMNAMLVISGAFGVFRRGLLMELDGFRQTIGEDIDLTIRIQDYLMQHPEKKMVCISEAICYTECPETWGDIFKQRIRWQKAFVDCVVKYHRLLLRHCFRRSFAFFVVMDAIVAGTFSTYFTVAAVVAALVFPSMNHEWLYWYVALSTVTTFVYNALAIHQSRKGTRVAWGELGHYAQVILLDLVFWRYMNFVFIILGTVLYFFNSSDWNKVTRANHEYSV